MSIQKKDMLTNFLQKLDKLIADNQVPPWQKPWLPQFGPLLSRIHNPVTNKPYQGLNALNLALSADINGFIDPRWMGSQQAKQLGWAVKPGVQGTSIYLPVFEKMTSDVRMEEVQEENMEIAPLLHFRIVKVFNAEQINGIPTLALPSSSQSLSEPGPLDIIARQLKVKVQEKPRPEAYYSPLLDLITLPPRSLFNDNYGRNSTFAHELAHASGHEKRLNRFLNNEFGSPAYCAEEITAEIASYLLCRELGLAYRGGNPDQTEEQHLAYTGFWMKTLQQQPEMISQAIIQGAEAARYLSQQWQIKKIIEQQSREDESFSD